MTAECHALSVQACTLRAAFDATFAAPLPSPPPATVALLLVQAGGERLALKRAELTGLARGENLVRTPGCSPAFLGLAEVHGALYPVWSLALLLGRPGAPAGWLVLAEARRAAPCAFACEAFAGMIFAPEASVVGPGRRDGPAGFAPTTVPWGHELVPIVDLPALQADIRKRQESMQPRRTTP